MRLQPSSGGRVGIIFGGAYARGKKFRAPGGGAPTRGVRVSMNKGLTSRHPAQSILAVDQRNPFDQRIPLRVLPQKRRSGSRGRNPRVGL